MARRFSKEEKGKGLFSEDKETYIKRIKVPCVDNSALIKENALTLIGRVTNPKEQRIWALIPALPHKWHLQGRATGSDLGNGCFQFRFEREDDLQRVLDNRPYHFAYWMVIIQKWEPIISASFPSQIPFWIRIKGLPLHFWIEEMICNIGKDLGTIQDHELTKTTARVRVLVDGLKPLTKEAIVEFDSEEESIIYLEYEKLENHCSRCYLMSHLKKDCPSYLMETQREESQQSGKLITYKKEVLPEQNGMHQSSRQQSPDGYYREYNSKATGEGRADTFHERVDRHGNIFGARVATKQTRVPSPPKVLENIRDDHHSWRGKGFESETETQIQSYNSPPYTKRQDLGKERNMFKKALFPQRGLSEWRVKPTEAAPSSDRRVSPGRMSLQNHVLQNPQGEAPQEAYKEQTEAQILNELNEATLLYLSCPDPTEAAARRQRVLAGDAMCQTQERVASLLRLQGSSSDQRRDTIQNLQIPSTSSKEQVMRELQETTKQYLSCVDPVEAAARRQ